jgi:hypothetical protein
MTQQLHLDPVGGISGDMFLAAMLSAFPWMREGVLKDWAAAGIADHVRLEVKDVREKGFACLQADVVCAHSAPPTAHWSDIRQRMVKSALRPNVRERAIAIFGLLAEAEAKCHGLPIEQVHFHEIADWDSLADIIGAASVLEQCGAASFSVGPIPTGKGRVKTQHGLIPVPAPATAELLKGFEFTDDGGKGERVTPTGAAILAHLVPRPVSSTQRGRLEAIGMGAGRLQIDGIPNILRVLVFSDQGRTTEQVSLIRFEVDDMTPEELAVALEHLRTREAVLDAGYVMGFGKKGRAQYSVTVMTRPHDAEDVITACFLETSTIGLRVETVARHTLAREETVQAGIPIKRVDRPGGATAKAESDALSPHVSLRERRARAHKAEATQEDGNV